MFGTKTSISSLFLSVALAQSPVVPLDLGNTWVYGGRAGNFTVEVTAVKDINGEQWSFVTGLPPGNVWLHQTAAGTILARDSDTDTPRVWVDLAADPGTPFKASVDACAAEGRIAKRPTSWTGAIGFFDNVLRVDYTGSRCADTGVVSDVFLPWVGLVERSVQTIAGPVSSQLLYARLGECTIISAGEASFGMTLRRDAATLSAFLHLRNGLADPLDILFPSGQQYDLAIKDANGKGVYSWSADKAFPAVVTHVTVPRGEKTWIITAPLTGLAPGSYTVEAWLTTNPIAYKASVPFRIPNPLP